MTTATTSDNDVVPEHVCRELIDVGADAVRRDLVLGSGGNLSVRLEADRYLVTCKGTWLDRLTVDDFCVIDGHGTVHRGNGEPTSEWKLHTRTYEARSDVNCVIHLHPQMSLMVDALGYPIRLLTMDHANYVRKVNRTDFYHNGTDELADTAAMAVADANCVVMAYHGCSCIGPTVDMAYRRALNLEQAAMMTYRLLTLNDTAATFPPEALDRLYHK
ncbi:L-fuculose-phosphate aldolase [Tamaricihabitans halophyticus]|uniref:L-fuculose-phosphate aldolase n=1 Tax=Tamaricihabitans halophyticus TaxID=1262583 RepID=A0A4R2QFD3_9PSEU|nr:class II aldolase/adducin family protein [Tamaricihabitans halophyticus]TCP47842.1 L-fuculose-phosphate aldolase [Tamaricihabitans halophyticus]